MAAVNRAALKAKWITGYKPLQADYYELFDSFFALLDDVGVYIPATEPALATGVLTLDCTDQQEAMFEPRLSVGVLTINTDFAVVLTNSATTKLISFVVQLTGTIIITLPADFNVSIPSSIGTWDNVADTLTLTAGTDDIIEFQILKYTSSSKWILKTSEVAT